MKQSIRHMLAAAALIGGTCTVASLVGCTAAQAPVTAGIATVTLNADKAFLTAQISFKTLQQIALAGVQSGQIKGTLKARVIALVDQGQSYENRAFQAQQASQSTAAAVAALTNVVAQLNALGIKEN